MNTEDPNQHQEYWRAPPTEPVGRVNHPQMQPPPRPQPHMPNMCAPGVPQQAYPYPQPLPPPRRNNAKAVGIVALAVLAVVLLVIVGLALNTSGSSPVAGGGIGASAPVTAVCQPGSYKHPSQDETPSFGDATDIAVCTAKIAWTSEPPVRPGEQYGPIWIVQYPSLGAAQDAAHEPMQAVMGSTAITTINGKTVLFIAGVDQTGVSLEPLAQFGFAITPASSPAQWLKDHGVQ